MTTITQKHRFFAVGTSLGDDVLVFGRMTATERLGNLFELDLDLLSERTDIDLLEVLGKDMTIRVELPQARGGGTRYFNGFVTRFSYLGMRGQRYGLYRARLSPWLWFLTRTSDCRIFQNQTVPDIIQSIFRGHGFTDFRNSLSGSYRTWEYCVQYRETDFNFVSRLMQQEGIYYYFAHENGKHSLVLADDPGAHAPFPGYDQVPYYPPDEQQLRDKDHIYEWVVEKQVQPGAYALNDFDATAPRKNLRAAASAPKSHAMADFEMYDYPGDYSEASDGNAYSTVRLQELLAQHEILHGEGIARGLSVGSVFSLTNCGREEQNRQYLVVSAVYELQSDAYESVAHVDVAGKPFVVHITAMDAQGHYRPPRTIPKPVVQGPQTAIVVGASGDEIHTDQYGRVKCQFHWDRYGAANQDSSCWIRVAQSWAGKKWGTLYLPRVGQEVIVDFLEGDPDRPIITGRVYNGVNMPPYTLPDNKTMSTLKSLSSTGGGGFNEFRFEDKKGEEQIFLHAEKNQDIRVKNNALEWIGNERHLIVKKKQFEQVEGEKHLIIKAGDGGNGDQFEKVEGDKHQKVQGDHNQKVNGTLSIKVDGDMQEKVGGSHALDATSAIHIKAGQTVVIEAGSQLTIKVGGSFVSIDPSGVTIQGTMVKINSGGASGSGAGSSPDAPQDPTAPQEAATADPGELSDTTSNPIQRQSHSLDSVSVGVYESSPPPGSSSFPSGAGGSPQAQALRNAAQSGAPFCEKCEEARRAEEARRTSGKS